MPISSNMLKQAFTSKTRFKIFKDQSSLESMIVVR